MRNNLEYKLWLAIEGAIIFDKNISKIIYNFFVDIFAEYSGPQQFGKMHDI